MNNPLLAIVVNHLWQSTLFAGAMWGLALLLRRNSARVRYSLWLAASLKFLLPFALLAAIGTQIPWHPEAAEQGAAASRVLTIASDITTPVAGEIKIPQRGRLEVEPDPPAQVRVALNLLLAWALGAMFVALRWLVRWREIPRALLASTAVAGIDFPAPVRATSMQIEPGVVGIFRPKLLLPAGITERLTPEQMRAVLAHERCHLRWHDNLTAALHMVVEMVFWFHPLVWWIGARLIEERERACDEQVIRDGCAPQSYAEGILAVCEHYIVSRLPCISGVSGADLRQRVERILKNSLSLKLDGPRKLILAIVACCSVAAPIAAGNFSGSLRQVFFSISASKAAELEYSRFLDSIEQVQRRPIPASPAAELCPAPTARALRRQKALAAAVRTLSANDGKNVLLYAVAANSIPDVKRLLASGAPRNGDQFTDQRIGKNLTLMHVAAMFGDVRMLETLANSGFPIDNPMVIEIKGKKRNGGTPLMIAMSLGRPENSRWLMQHGADLNQLTVTSFTPISAAIGCGNQEMVALMLRAGALPNSLSFTLASKHGIDLRGDQPWRAAVGDHAEISADFDGDGTADRARLLVSADEKRQGLFVQLSSRGADNWIHAAEGNSTTLPMLPMGISLARPASYATACAKGYGSPCTASEPKELVLERPGIDFYVEESASSIVYWDKSSGGFERLSVSK